MRNDWVVKDIYSIPCGRLANGEKAIRVFKGYNGSKWARVNYNEAVSRLYRYDAINGLWKLHSEHCGEREVEIF